MGRSPAKPAKRGQPKFTPGGLRVKHYFYRFSASRSFVNALQRDRVERADGEIDRRAQAPIVNDVLDFSKLEAGQFEIRPRSVPAVEATADSLIMFKAQADEKGLELRLLSEIDLRRHIFVDPERLRQILLNLIGNAVKFTTSGHVTVSLDWRQGKLLVEVADSGPGLSKEQQEKLFQRFSQVDGSSTRKHGGTGLGLAICKGLVEAMGGRIGVRSLSGEGACFYFEIDAPAADAPADDSQEAVAFGLEGIRILVADDNPSNRELVKALLERLGACVCEAADGLEAVESAAMAPFDVILMDVRMPVLDGRAALERIRLGGGPNLAVPIIAFSADSELPTGPDFAFDGFIAKPIEPVLLVETVALAAVGRLVLSAEEVRRA